MTNTGHDARTAAILENLQRRHSTHHEVVKEAIPESLEQRLSALEDAVNVLAGSLSEAAASYATLLDKCRALDARVDTIKIETKEVAA